MNTTRKKASLNPQRRNLYFRRALTPILRDTIYLYLMENWTCHKYSSCELALLTRFSTSEVKGQGHDENINL